MKSTMKKTMAAFFACLMMISLITACGGSGITQEQYDNLSKEKEAEAYPGIFLFNFRKIHIFYTL